MEQKDSPSRGSSAAGPASAEKPAPAPPPSNAAEQDALTLSPDDTPVAYDPADYRWVPVRRVPRRDGWTEEKQRLFIEHLADTGIVALAASAVGMTRESAYRLRRSPQGAAFARAWDAARAHAGCLLEDVAFERAIEGVAHNVYDECGEVVCTRRVHNDRLLTFLLRHLKPERYGAGPTRGDAAPDDAPAALQATLHDMEPVLPAPPEQLIAPDTLAMELEVADIADGGLPFFYREQRPVKTPEQIECAQVAAQAARGQAICERLERKQPHEAITITRQDMVDISRYLDPASRFTRSTKRYR